MSPLMTSTNTHIDTPFFLSLHIILVGGGNRWCLSNPLSLKAGYVPVHTHSFITCIHKNTGNIDTSTHL